ncbi:GH1 family beta-glucosidase [Luteipulveratus mongoliensis]|uniref:Beta-glucosidase n=1 Tax=Luteipulveratus mongoliensis TaxID=571913 RepID=A0A0K1JFX1_9MICO|nr:GH1 family beta-glucosidase [Luteipulveratus mongoliensis]AKU15483.1 beta-glucosidase [Luteipulveratus mongoliensis]
MENPPAFPSSFEWGVGASGFQTEGSLQAGGRGRSVWDDFCAEPGRIAGGDTPATAADFYHRYAEDVGLVGDLGADVYRFSVAWPRIVPTGSGEINKAGLDFYDRVVDEMCAAGLKPAPTLYHWDTPSPLEEAGGWMNRDTALRFGEYAAVVAERLADRAAYWIPLNEPVVLTFLGYALGQFAPGKAMMFDSLPTVHHQLLAHGLSVQAIRAAGGSGIGTANPHAPNWPASDATADVEAAELSSTLNNWLWSDPILRGAYPEGWADAMPGPVEDDLKVISSPLDFYGVNYYSPSRISAPTGEASAINGYELSADIPFTVLEPEGPTTGLGGEINPDGLREILVTLTERYGDALPPLVITENGTSQQPGTEEPGDDGKVHDDGRISYLDSHIRAVRRAIDDGADVRGYWVWSPTDNFEWTHGYTQRFGLVHVDYETLKRTPKDSYAWFQQLIASQ